MCQFNHTQSISNIFLPIRFAASVDQDDAVAFTTSPVIVGTNRNATETTFEETESPFEMTNNGTSQTNVTASETTSVVVNQTTVSPTSKSEVETSTTPSYSNKTDEVTTDKPFKRQANSTCRCILKPNSLLLLLREKLYVDELLTSNTGYTSDEFDCHRGREASRSCEQLCIKQFTDLTNNFDLKTPARDNLTLAEAICDRIGSTIFPTTFGVAGELSCYLKTSPTNVLRNTLLEAHLSKPSGRMSCRHGHVHIF